MPYFATFARMSAVSVLMLAYNAADYIAEAIKSILDQSFTDFELIIYNDGSTDDTATIVGQFSDPRIRFIDSPVNQGLSYGRQATLQAATCKYVAILDSDDIAFPDRLQKLYSFLEANPNVALCGGNAVLIDEHGNGSGELLHQPYSTKDLKVTFFFNNVFVNSSVMYRRDAALQVGGYRDMAPVEDYDLFVRIADQYAVHTFNEPLIYYRIHRENTSQKSYKQAVKRLRIVKENQLKLLGVNAEKYVDIFDAMLGSDYWRFSIEEFFDFLVTLMQANRTFCKLPKLAFEKRLYTFWYNLVMATVQKREAVHLLIKKPLYKISVLTFKQFRRILKLRLKIFSDNETFR